MLKETDIQRFYKDVEKLKLKFPVAAIAKATGYSKGNVSSYLSKKLTPSENFITEFYKKFADSFKIVPNETNIEGSYQIHRRTLKNSESPNDLLFYEIGANAGTVFSGEILPVTKGEGVLHVSDLFRNSQYAIRISGNSMTPNYPSGAIIGIREIPDKMITPGSVYVIEKDNDLWIKRLFYFNDDQGSGLFECVSDNDMVYKDGGRRGKMYYPPFQIEVDRVRRLFKVTGIYKANELTVIN